MKRRLRWLGIVGLTAGLLLSNGTLRGAQSAWVDDPPPSALALIREGPWRVSEARYYQSQVQLTITPQVTEPFFAIQVSAAATINVRVKVTSYPAGATGAVTLEDDFTVAFNGMGGFSQQRAFLIQPAQALALTASSSPSLPASVTFEIQAPLDHNRLFIEIEATVSRPASFVELW